MKGGRHESRLSSSDTVGDLYDCEDSDELCAKQGKGKRLWKKVKYQLTDYHSLPAYLKDNEFILNHYRADWPLKQVLLSIFTIHNETLNVWTHLIGFSLFLFLTIYTAMQIPEVVDLNSLKQFPNMLRRADLAKIQAELMKCVSSLSEMPVLNRLKDGLKTSLPSMDFLSSLSSDWSMADLLNYCLPGHFSIPNQREDGVEISPLMIQPVARWPFFAFLGGAMFCLLASSTCHLLCCYSERLAYIMLRLDYTGIAVLISTSFYPPIYYSFMCNPFLCNLYLSFITLLGIATIAFSLLPVFQKPEFRTFRASLFFGMGVSGVVPILHKLIVYRNQPEAVQTTCYEILMGTLYGVGALIYAKRIPERWRPGMFDIAGHSHQIFHVLVVAAAYTHYQAGLIYLRWRDLEGCA